jgi:SAM-dependent methyltransferase
VGGAGLVVALDLSVEMLKRAGTDLLCVVGKMPAIPLVDESFDAATSSFVLSHIEDYGSALRDMVRVLRAGGRIAVSAWADEDNEYDALWGQVARRFVDSHALEQAVQGCRPYQQWLSDPDHLRDAVREAGADKVSLHTHEYHADVPLADFLIIKSALLSGRFVRSVLSADEWSRFHDEINGAFAPHGEYLHVAQHAHMAVGTKPAASSS